MRTGYGCVEAIIAHGVFFCGGGARQFCCVPGLHSAYASSGKGRWCILAESV